MSENQKKYGTISDGVYTLQETDNTNQYNFYRNDGETLENVGRAAMDLYQNYMIKKMFSGEIADGIASNIEFVTSSDKKSIRLTVNKLFDVPPITIRVQPKEQKSVKTLIKSLFNKKNK